MELPELPVILRIDHSLAKQIMANNHLNKSICKEISAGFTELMELLGIPGFPMIQTDTLGEEGKSGRNFMSITVHGQTCRYSEELIQNIYCYINGVPAGTKITPAQVLSWLRALADDEDKEKRIHDHKILEEYLRIVCIEIAKRQPGLLLGEQQVEDYKNSLKSSKNKFELKREYWPDNTRLRIILTEVLNLRISIAQKEVVAEILQRGFSLDRSSEEIIEDLVTALKPDVIEIQLSQEYLRELTNAVTDQTKGTFSLMRDGLFYELGVHYPEFSFVTVDNLRGGGFTFKINHLTTIPQIGLREEECLVNDTTDRLTLLNISGKPAINPANGIEFSIINIAHQNIAETAGLTTWNQLGFLILTFSCELRTNSHCLLNCEAVRELKETLAQAFPTLVFSIGERFSNEKLTRVFRLLLSEEISLRNLRQIFELMLDFEYIVTDDSKYIIFDDRLPTHSLPDELWLEDPRNLAKFVRTGMKRYLSHKYTRGGNTLVVYLLDPKIERLLADHQNQGIPVSNHDHERILNAVKVEVPTQQQTTSISTILTRVSIRGYMREIIKQEFPRLPVLAYQELSPDMNIQPIARINYNKE